jgi:hypothetical protein
LKNEVKKESWSFISFANGFQDIFQIYGFCCNIAQGAKVTIKMLYFPQLLNTDLLKQIFGAN